MAQLSECKICKKEVSTIATKCPHCGQKNPTSTWKKMIVGCLVLIAIVFGIWKYISGDEITYSADTEQPVTITENAILLDVCDVLPARQYYDGETRVSSDTVFQISVINNAKLMFDGQKASSISLRDDNFDINILVAKRALRVGFEQEISCDERQEKRYFEIVGGERANASYFKRLPLRHRSNFEKLRVIGFNEQQKKITFEISFELTSIDVDGGKLSGTALIFSLEADDFDLLFKW